VAYKVINLVANLIELCEALHYGLTDEKMACIKGVDSTHVRLLRFVRR